MNFNIYIDDHLATELVHFCQIAHKKRNTVIREALENYIHQFSTSEWPKAILEFKGIPEIEAFETSRDELSPDNRPILFEDD